MCKKKNQKCKKKLSTKEQSEFTLFQSLVLFLQRCFSSHLSYKIEDVNTFHQYIHVTILSRTHYCISLHTDTRRIPSDHATHTQTHRASLLRNILEQVLDHQCEVLLLLGNTGIALTSYKCLTLRSKSRLLPQGN